MAQVLKAPQNFRITGRDRSAQLTWDEVSGAAGYRMFFYDGSEPDKVFKTRYAQGCTRVILGFTNGREYFAEVCAYSVKDGREMLGERSQKVRFVPISLKLTAQKVVCLDLGETAQLFVGRSGDSSGGYARADHRKGRGYGAHYDNLREPPDLRYPRGGRARPFSAPREGCHDVHRGYHVRGQTPAACLRAPARLLRFVQAGQGYSLRGGLHRRSA